MQTSFEPYADEFSTLGILPDLPVVEQALSEADLLPIIGFYDGVIAGDDSFTRRVLENAGRLQIISKWGVGIDGIDMAAAANLGIKVTNTPAMFDSEVADVCIGYMVLLARELHRIDSAVRSGRWLKVRGITLAGRTLGVVGLGSIGLAVAKRAQAMDMDIVGFDVNPAARALASSRGVKVLSLNDLLAAADVISLNCPLTADNRHLLNREAFGQMREGVLVINTARGPLVDEEALDAALVSGRVAGAALDVFECEPLQAGHPLMRHSQVVFGSHNSSNTTDAVATVSAQAVRNLIAGLARP
jgi:D-3-phosphoglycerate dehydrogenase